MAFFPPRHVDLEITAGSLLNSTWNRPRSATNLQSSPLNTFFAAKITTLVASHYVARTRSDSTLSFPRPGKSPGTSSRFCDHDDTVIILVLRVLGCFCFAETRTTTKRLGARRSSLNLFRLFVIMQLAVC
jgi:hypothetical protein